MARFDGIPVAAGGRFGGIAVASQPRAYSPRDPSSITSEMDAYDAMAAASRAGDAESAERLRRRAQEIMVESMPAWQRVAAGAGKSIMDTGRGIGQLFSMVDDADVAEARARDEALMGSGFGLAGNIVGQAAQMAVPLGAGGRIAGLLGRASPFVGAAARGATFSGAQGTIEEESRLENAGIGGLLGGAGQGVAAGVGRIARGINMDDATRGLLRHADDRGLRFSAGQMTENPMARTVISQMERMPFSGAGAAREANQTALNRAVSETFGAADDKVTSDVFRAAKSRLGGEFERLSANNSLAITPKLLGELEQIKVDAARLTAGDTGRVVSNWVDDLLSKAENGAVPGRAYQSFDSKVGKVMKGGGETSTWLGDLRGTVRSAMDDSIIPDDQAAWRLVRQQYANLKTVEPLVAKAPTGDISPAALMGRVTADKAGKVRMASGRGGELGELARIGQRFMKEAPDSGTADRHVVNASLVAGLLGLQQTNIISPEQLAIAGGLLGGNRAALGLLRNQSVLRGASAPLAGAASATAALRTVPAAAGNARSRGELIDVGGGRMMTKEQARKLGLIQ